MSERKIMLLTGLNIGEETKGATAEWASDQTDAHTVWRSGGSQAGHHIVRSDGSEQMLSHFGAGTFDGARTYLKHMVINPVDLFTEGLQLEEKGVEKPFDLITISQDCLTTVPYHSAMSRFREILRGDNKKGTVGKGVGEALKDAGDPMISIRAGEFRGNKEALIQKVEAIRYKKIAQAHELMQELGITELPEEALAEIEILQDANLVPTIVDSFQYLAEIVNIVDDTYLDTLMAKKGTIVGEPSHGALLHPFYGFLPHVTQVDPTGQDVLKTVQERNYDGDIIRIGVSRSYMTRHGAGPLVSQSTEMTRAIQETHNNVGNDWLGEFRNGQYDIVATNYALAAAGGKESFTGLSISYMDVLANHDSWDICTGYTYTGPENDLGTFFERDGETITGIKLRTDEDIAKHDRNQLRLTQILKDCEPILITLRPTETQTLEEVFLAYVEEHIGLPVVATAHGPRKEDRKARAGWEDLFSPTQKSKEVAFS